MRGKRHTTHDERPVADGDSPGSFDIRHAHQEGPLNTREFAIALAQRAGELLLEYRRNGLAEDAIREKAGHFDIVTVADVAAERLIVAALQSAYPDHSIYAEESAQGQAPDVEWLWVVDPLDGTTNYAHGLPIFGVNLALAHFGVPVLGVTHDPSAGRTYWAEAGGGAWVRAAGHDRPIAVAGVAAIERALLASGFVAARKERPLHNRAEFNALDLRSQSVRRLGSAALALAWVASGFLEAYWESELKPWDYAAGWVLVTEAGGRITEHSGAPLRLDSLSLIASNGQPGIYQVIEDTLRTARASSNRD